jgi:YfiH family protein
MMSTATYSQLYQITFQNLPVLRIRAFDAYPNLAHAIFTRQGGVSQAPFESLNLSIVVGDDDQDVAENFWRACRVVDTTPDRTVSCYLAHGVDILTISQANRRPVMDSKADGLITGERDVYLVMRFGDCTPLILFDPIHSAVGLAHAGWRGTMQNAAGAVVNEMVRQLGCQPRNIIAVIGPSIGPCCYEVGPDVMAAAQTLINSSRLFTRRNGNTQRVHFNLWEANRRQLADCGLQQIIQSELCTACNTDLFFSHRAEKGLTGRFGVIIGLRGTAA